MADHLGAYAHSASGRNASVGVYGVAGMVRGHGYEGHTVLDQHGGLDGAVTEPVERKVRRVQSGGLEALLEEGVELGLLQRDPGLAGLGGDPEHRGVGAARVVAIDGGESVQRPDRAPVGVGRSRERDSLDTLPVLDGLRLADGKDHAVLDPGDVAPGEDLNQVNTFTGNGEEIA